MLKNGTVRYDETGQCEEYEKTQKCSLLLNKSYLYKLAISDIEIEEKAPTP